MKLCEYLSSQPRLEGKERAGGYFVFHTLFNEEYMRRRLNIKQKHIKALEVYVPKKKNVPMHKHSEGREFFIPCKEGLHITLEKGEITCNQITEIPPGTYHSLKGEQHFYAIKAFDNSFDKILK
ncbi:MAG: hypothetical protein ACOCQX_01470 [Candidatus Nanoarchaeia archaeon]